MSRRKSPLYPDRVSVLIAATDPLLRVFAVVSDVCSEEDCMKNLATLRMGMGRIRAEWRQAVKEMDPDA